MSTRLNEPNRLVLQREIQILAGKSQLVNDKTGQSQQTVANRVRPTWLTVQGKMPMSQKRKYLSIFSRKYRKL